MLRKYWNFGNQAEDGGNMGFWRTNINMILLVLSWWNLRNTNYDCSTRWWYVILTTLHKPSFDISTFNFISIIELFTNISPCKASAYNVGDPGSIPGFGRSSGEGNGNQLQCSCLENPEWTEEPGSLQSMGSPRVGHDWVVKLSTFIGSFGLICSPWTLTLKSWWCRGAGTAVVVVVCNRIEIPEQQWSGVEGWIIVARDSRHWQWRQRCLDQTNSSSWF